MHTRGRPTLDGAPPSIEDTYTRIRTVIHCRRLNVHVPRLSVGGHYTASALMLVFFYRCLGEIKTIGELKQFLVENGCHTMNPQPRHLGLQHGFCFLVQNGIHPRHPTPLRRGQYCLLDIRKGHPSASVKARHRCSTLTPAQFELLRRRYHDRCAVCGSQDGQPHLKNALVRTTLERGHADPRRPLTVDNCIPMCHLCNRAYKNRATFNSRGIVVDWQIGGGEDIC